MKKIVLIFVLSFMFASSANSEDIINITNGEWPPFLSQDLPHYGYTSHIVSMAFDEVGVKVNYGFFPWKRAIDLPKTEPEKWHGSVVWSYRENRADFFYYSQPVITQIHVLFHLKNNPPVIWKSIEDLKGVKVGIILGSSAPTFEDADKKGILKLVRAKNTKSLFLMLLAGRIDVIPLVKDGGYYYIRTKLPKDKQELITDSPTIFEPEKYCLILSRKNPKNKQLLDLFNTGLEKLHTSKRYFHLTERLYNGKYDSK